MEAATPLRPPSIRLFGERVAVDGLLIDDECAVRLVRERVDAGEDAAGLLTDAIEIGARVIDREQTGANVEAVRVELEKAAGSLDELFTQRARVVAEELAGKLDEAFGPESGQLAQAMRRHFSDESAGAVQHRVREMVSELLARQREELLRQFSSADGRNPLADFKAAAVGAMRQASDRQDQALQVMTERMAALERELQGLRDEREAAERLEAERERGTAKGRTFEEGVVEALEAIAAAQGDDAEAVGDLKGTTRKTGDVVVGIEGCRGPARGRIVFEAKDSRLSRPEALRELDRARAERDADFAVLVVCGEENLPARSHPLREINGDKLFVAFDPEGEGRLSLEVGYALARARVLMARAESEGLDAGALRETVERAVGAMEDVRRVKQQLTGATTSIDTAREILETLAAAVRGHLAEIERLLISDEG